MYPFEQNPQSTADVRGQIRPSLQYLYKRSYWDYFIAPDKSSSQNAFLCLVYDEKQL